MCDDSIVDVLAIRFYTVLPKYTAQTGHSVIFYCLRIYLSLSIYHCVVTACVAACVCEYECVGYELNILNINKMHLF